MLLSRTPKKSIEDRNVVEKETKNKHGKVRTALVGAVLMTKCGVREVVRK